MVRQAIFNILHAHGKPQDSYVIDAFCGTGALGLEALSRGAAHCFFIDNDKTSLSYTRRNTLNAKADEQSTIMQFDILKPPPFEDKFPADLVFLDPPYRNGFVYPALTALAAKGWLQPDALCVAECEEELAASAPAGFALLDNRVYGGTRVLFLKWTG
jgi:16S rRNA (guanine966-N2)-methyltransferase